MQCISLPQSNLHLGPAPGDEDRVYGIDAVATDQGILTAWKLEPHELEEFVHTGTVYILLSTDQFPPMQVRAQNPFGGFVPPPPPNETLSGIITEL